MTNTELQERIAFLEARHQELLERNNELLAQSRRERAQKVEILRAFDTLLSASLAFAADLERRIKDGQTLRAALRCHAALSLPDIN